LLVRRQREIESASGTDAGQARGCAKHCFVPGHQFASPYRQD